MNRFLTAADQLPFVGKRVRAVAEEEARKIAWVKSIIKNGGRDLPWNITISSRLYRLLDDDFYVELSRQNKGFQPDLVNCLIIPSLLEQKRSWMAMRHYDVSEEFWSEIWDRAQRIKKEIKILYLPLPTYWFDLDTPLGIFNIYGLGVNTTNCGLGLAIRNVFGVGDGYLTGNSVIEGDITLIDTRRALIYNSQISVQDGVTLEIGLDVVIDHAYLEISGLPGQKVVIPNGTKIIQSKISGDLNGLQDNNLIYGVDGIIRFPMVRNTLFTSWRNADGDLVLTYQSLDFNPKGVDTKLRIQNVDKPLPNLGSTSLAQLFTQNKKIRLDPISTNLSNRPQTFPDHRNTYPATLPATNEPDRALKQEELETITTAFGKGIAALTTKDITLENIVVISPALVAPAEVSGGILYINPNTLRGPPDQLRVIFEGHELFHLLHPELSPEVSEIQAQAYTIEYLISHNLLESHIEFLRNNTIGLIPDQAWFIRLQLEYFIIKLGLAPSDIIHIKGLIRKYNAAQVILTIAENFLPSALLTEEQMLELLGGIDYEAILSDEANSIAAGAVVLTTNPMDGGLGTAVARESYLEQNPTDRDINPETNRARIGAKATDLFFFNVGLEGKDAGGNPKEFTINRLSIAEIKLLRVISDARNYNSVIFQPLVNKDSARSYKDLLDSVYLLDRIDDTRLTKRTYRKVMAELGIIILEGDAEMLYQMDLPIIDIETDWLTDKYTAPGGHGQWGVRLLYAALNFQQPAGDSNTYIRAFYNGDGIANFPPASIIGWMRQNKIPIVMVSTTKAGLDRKGGQLGLQRVKDAIRVQILELAQAGKAGRAHVGRFYEIGLSSGARSINGRDVLNAPDMPYTYTNRPNKQYFNTNIALINETILGAILQELAKLENVEFEGKFLSGRELIERIISPDLIENVRRKSDGRDYTQLEGAIASSLLNLNAFFSASTDPEVKAILAKYEVSRFLMIVNVDTPNRTDVFTPVKNSFDFWFQAYSDYYQLDAQSWTLRDRQIDQVPPSVEIISYKQDAAGNFILDDKGERQDDKYWADLQNVINAFGKASTRELEALTIEGRVLLRDAILKGQVTITSRYPGISDLNSSQVREQLDQAGDEPLVLDNIIINIGGDGKIAAESINASSGSNSTKLYSFAPIVFLSSIFVPVLADIFNWISNNSVWVTLIGLGIGLFFAIWHYFFHVRWKENVILESINRLTAKYNSIDETFQENGVDVQRFYNNTDYFARNPDGEYTEFSTSNPFVVQWPLKDYEGGERLVENLSKIINEINEILGQGYISWAKPEYWHSTVFSIRKSLHPDVYKGIDHSDIQRKVREVLRNAQPYEIIFNRILISDNGTVIAVGYVNNVQLSILRDTLKQGVPEGHRTDVVHITLGRITKNPSVKQQDQLKRFTQEHKGIELGRIMVDFVTYATYARVPEPIVREVYRQYLNRKDVGNKGRTVLVTGGAGYIGSFVTRELLAQGYRVIVYDNLSSGHRQALPEEVVFIEGDLADRKLLERTFKEYRPGAVIHLAAFIEAMESTQRPAKYFYNNVAHTINLLEAMAHNGVKHIIFSSSAAVYDDSQESPLTEESPTQPASPYGESKLMAEKALSTYAQKRGIRFISLRYFNVAGASQDALIGEAHSPETHIIPIVLEVALGKRQELQIRGTDYPTPDGTAVRDFIHVEDLARAHILALEYLMRTNQSEIINVGTGTGTSVRQIVDAVERLIDRELPKRITPHRRGGTATLVASFQKAERLLGWSSRLGINEIVRTAWAWHQAHPEGFGAAQKPRPESSEADYLTAILNKIRANKVLEPDLKSEIINRLFNDLAETLREAGLKDTQEILAAVFSRDIWRGLIISDQELMALLSKFLALSLRRDDAFEVSSFLEVLIQDKSYHFLPEAERLTRSYLVVYRIDKPIRVATVCSMYGGQIRLLKPKVHPFGEDNLRVKLEQLDGLFGINPKVKWELILVQDGEDRRANDPLRRLRTMDMARQIILEEYLDAFTSGQIRIYELSPEEKIKLGSVRTGATTYGARQALKQGADFVIITDGDVSADVGQSGLLLEPLLHAEKAVAVGSRQARGAVVRGRRFIRRITSPGFNIFSRIFLPLGDIRDTQCGFKGYSREVLEKILPVDEQNRFDPEFVYNFAGEVNLLWRARLLGYQLKEIPIAWFDTPITTVRRRDVLNMAQGVLKQRPYVKQWRQRTNSDIGISTSLRGSTKARDIKAYAMPTREEKIRVAISQYDIGATLPIVVISEELSGGIAWRRPLKLVTPKGEFVLKMIGETLEETRFSISVIRLLHRNGIPVPELMKTQESNPDETDSYFIKIGNQFYVLEEYKSGQHVDRLQAQTRHFQNMGKLLAQMHNLVEGLIPEGQKTAALVIEILRHRYELEDLRQRLSQKESARLTRGEFLFLSLYDELMRQFDIAKTNLSEEEYQKLPKVVVHGDLTFPNLLFSNEDEIVAVLDWERSRIQPRVEDFKNPIMVVDPQRGRAYDFSSLVSLIAAYQQNTHHRLTEQELQAIPEVLRVTFLWEFSSRFLLRMKELEEDAAYERVSRLILKLEEFIKDFPGTDESKERFIRAIQEEEDLVASKRIAMIGTGYVGLVTGACFAELGNQVICVDIDKEKISRLQQGLISMYEPGLEEMVRKNINEGRLGFTADLEKAVSWAQVIFICVGTPSLATGEANFSYVEAATKEIARLIKGYKVVVVKSTVPVGGAERIRGIILENSPAGTEFDVVSNPEFLSEGTAIRDFLYPGRTVIGTNSERAQNIMQSLYSPIGANLIIAGHREAELIKYASNTFLSASISFINEIARLCEIIGADITDVARALRLDRRIPEGSFLSAGLGFGGSCFPKDLSSLIQMAIAVGYETRLLTAAQDINITQRSDFVAKVKEALEGDLNGKVVGILGLSFKPNTDDIREAPSVDIINGLQKEGAKIKAYDPVAMETAQVILKDVQYCLNPYEVAEGSEVLCIITEWNEFKELDLGRIKSLLKQPLIIDGRNIFDLELMRQLGVRYISIGRPEVRPNLTRSDSDGPSVSPIQNTESKYPAAMPTTDEPDRAPSRSELKKITRAFGGRNVLAAHRITLNTTNVVISPFLAVPAEVRGGVLLVNPNTLRGPPPGQLRVIFEGHELFHLLGQNEQDARESTIQYLVTHNLLNSHIDFLGANDVGLVPDADWLDALYVAQPITAEQTSLGQRKIIMISPEIDPLSKTGGLADVLKAFPEELARLGHRVSVITMLYDSIDKERFNLEDLGITVPVVIGREEDAQEELEITEAKVYRVRMNGVTVYLLEHPLYTKFIYLGDRRAHLDSVMRMGINVPEEMSREHFLHTLSFKQAVFFKEASLRAIAAIEELSNPDIIHLHDWQTGLIAAALKEEPGYRDNPRLNRAAVIFTIHNLAYQGRFNKMLLSLSGLPAGVYDEADVSSELNIGFQGDINALKAGVVYADYVTTVSPTYANEILTRRFGEGLEDSLQRRKQRNQLRGIVNGLDVVEFNPATDPRLRDYPGFVNYTFDRLIEGKLQNKISLRALLRSKGFDMRDPRNPDAPLIGIVARLVNQKGVDIAVTAMREILLANPDVQFVVSGSIDGENVLRSQLEALQEIFAGRVAIAFGYDEDLSRKVYAASDIFLMPSRFEPCGLTQLISFRYGAIPVVHKVGGLSDTVFDYVGEHQDRGIGFVFEHFSAEDLRSGIERALNLRKEARRIWNLLLEHNTEVDYSWRIPAREYLQMYEEAMERKRITQDADPASSKSDVPNTYDLDVPAEFKAPRQYTQAEAILREDVYVLRRATQVRFLGRQREILSDRLNQLVNITRRGPPEVVFVITTGKTLTQGKVAAVNLGQPISKDYPENTVFIHPYFFNISQEDLAKENLTLEQLQLKILYHELISHIAKGITDEAEAMRDTEMDFYKYCKLENGQVVLETQPLIFGDNQVVVKILLSAICRSDVKEITDSRDIPEDRGPLFGHELVGEVVFAKEGIGLAVGQRVTFNPNITENRTTGFAEYLMIKDRVTEALNVVPDDIPTEVAVFSEPFSCVVRSMSKVLQHMGLDNLSDKKVAVIGAGNAGMFHVWLAEHYQAGEITLLNIDDGRLAFIKERKLFAGRTIIFDKDESVIEDLGAEEDKYDVVIIVTTRVTPKVLLLSSSLVKGGGYIHIYGGTRKGQSFANQDIDSTRRKDSKAEVAIDNIKTIYVTGAYGTQSEDFQNAFTLLRMPRFTNRLLLMISQVISLEELSEFIMDMAVGNKDYPGKVLISNRFTPGEFELYDAIAEAWDMKMAAGNVFKYDLSEVRRERVGRLHKMFNPRRIGKTPPQMDTASLNQPFNPNAFHFNKVGDIEVIAKGVNLGGVDTDIIVNVNPFLRGHILITPERAKEHNQYFIPQAAIAALEILKRVNRRSYKVTYNSVGAFASLNHLHLQALDYPEEKMPVEEQEKELVFESKGVSVWTLPNWPVRALVLTSSNTQELQAELLRLISILHELNQPFNIVSTYDNQYYSIYVFPRKFQGPSKFGTGVAYLELSGEILFVQQDDKTMEESLGVYEEASEVDMVEEISAVGIDGIRFEDIVRKFKLDDRSQNFDPARSKSGEELTQEEVSQDIVQSGSRELTQAEYQRVLEAAEQVKQFLRATIREAWIPKLEELLADQGKLRSGPFKLIYGAIMNGILYLYVNPETNLILDGEPLQLELTILHETAAASLNSHEENLGLEREYVFTAIRSEGVYELGGVGESIKTYLIESKSKRHNRDYLAIIKELFKPTGLAFIKKASESMLSSIIDLLNLFERFEASRLNAAKVTTLEDIKDSADYRKYYLETMIAILEGKIAVDCLFAGAATRMGKGPLYGVDPWGVVSNVVKGGLVSEEIRIRTVLSLVRYDESLFGILKQKSGLTEEALNKLVNKTHYEPKHLPKETQEDFVRVAIDEEIAQKAMEVIDRLAVKGIGLGPRQLIQLRIALEELTGE